MANDELLQRHSFPKSIPEIGGIVSEEWLSNQIHKAEDDLTVKEKILSKLEEQKEKDTGNFDTTSNGDAIYTSKEEKQSEETKTDGFIVEKPLDKLSRIDQDLESLNLAHEYVLVTTSMTDEVLSTETPLYKMVSICTKLGAILIKHPSFEKSTASAPLSNVKYPQRIAYQNLYNQILQRYEAIYKHARARTILALRRYIRKSGFPSTKGCVAVRDQFSDLFQNQNWPADDVFEKIDEDKVGVAVHASLLTKLEIVHHSLTHRNSAGKDAKDLHRQRIDVMDEFCRPIVERVRYHFLQNTTDMERNVGNTTSAKEKTAGKGTDSNMLRATSSRLDRLPEWLFQYLRDVIITNGVFGVICDCIQLMIDLVINYVRKEIEKLNIIGAEGTKLQSNRLLINNAPCSYIPDIKAASYFLTEIIHTCRHVLHVRDFFRRIMIVQKENETASIPTLLLCKAFEQILYFDEFTLKLANQSHGYNTSDEEGMMSLSSYKNTNETEEVLLAKREIKIPHLTDLFIASNPSFFTWWMEVEKDRAVKLLRSVSSKHADKVRSTGDIMESTNNQKISPITETLVSLLHSIELKTKFISGPTQNREFTANVAIPVCMEFMEIMHKDASTLRNLLIRRRKNILPSVKELESNILGWIEVITGTRLASLALLRKAIEHKIAAASSSEIQHDLERVGKSLQKLYGAMIEELSSAFVETILMEKAKLASYFMRCAYTLSSPPDSIMEVRTLSPELNEVIHLLSIVVGICNRFEVVASKLSHWDNIDALNHLPMELTNNPEYGGEENFDDMISSISGYAPLAIKQNIAGRIQELFLEVALDVHDVIPEINVQGALQFQFDIGTIIEIFSPNLSSLRERDRNLRRLEDVAHLMILDSKKFSSLREALRALVENNGEDLPSIESNYCNPKDDAIDRKAFLFYDDFEADDKLMDEAQSMLFAQGFLSLKLSDVVRIMNRRKA